MFRNIILCSTILVICPQRAAMLHNVVNTFGFNVEVIQIISTSHPFGQESHHIYIVTLTW